MKRLVQAGVFAVVLVAIATVAAQSPAADVTFRGLIDAKNIGEYMRVMAARPHHLGSPYGKQTADWILARFKEWGWEATIESYDVLFPTPKERVLELLGPAPFKATLQEPPVAVDPTSSQQSEQLPSFNAYSVDGDVTGPLVYVNYGRPSDYEELARRGISVKGAIVIARYGQARRDRLSDLLRSSRRRVLCGRSVSGRPDAESRRRAARQRHGHADVSR